MAILIVWTTDVEQVRSLADEGYEPVECSFGNHDSVVGQLTMDHHGCHSELEGVALRAYRDYFGARKSDPRFVVTGVADADATFAIAALAGVLPHPSRTAELEKAPPSVKAASTKDISSLAELVNRVDVAPIGVRLEESEEGTMLLLWNQMSSSNQDATAFHAGIDRFRVHQFRLADLEEGDSLVVKMFFKILFKFAVDVLTVVNVKENRCFLVLEIKKQPITAGNS